MMRSPALTPARVEAYVRFWWPRFDTYDMARMLGVHESVVANALARLRDRRGR